VHHRGKTTFVPNIMRFGREKSQIQKGIEYENNQFFFDFLFFNIIWK